MNKIPLYLFLLASLPTVFPAQLPAQVYNIRDFGAKGDGRDSDQAAFAAVADRLAAQGGTLLIPYGHYEVPGGIHINYTGNRRLHIKGIPGPDGALPVIRSSRLGDIFFINGYYATPAGDVLVEQLEVRGHNPAYSSRHPYYGGRAYQTALRIVDKERVTVRQCHIRNVYGNGIYIGSSNPASTPLSHRMQSATIAHNQIENTWGANPQAAGKAVYDDYGDGIYLTNVRSGRVSGNRIINNLAETRQFGRAGVVLEYDTEGITVEKNIVAGYDRNIHLEACIGNHRIRNNNLTGTDFGILVWNTCNNGPLKPLSITGNYISNAGIPALRELRTIRHASERALVYIGNHQGCSQQVTLRGNQLQVTGQSALVNNKVLYLAPGIRPGNNNYRIDTGNGHTRPVNQLGTRATAL